MCQVHSTPNVSQVDAGKKIYLDPHLTGASQWTLGKGRGEVCGRVEELRKGGLLNRSWVSGRAGIVVMCGRRFELGGCARTSRAGKIVGLAQ